MFLIYLLTLKIGVRSEINTSYCKESDVQILIRV